MAGPCAQLLRARAGLPAAAAAALPVRRRVADRRRPHAAPHRRRPHHPARARQLAGAAALCRPNMPWLPVTRCAKAMASYSWLPSPVDASCGPRYALANRALAAVMPHGFGCLPRLGLRICIRQSVSGWNAWRGKTREQTPRVSCQDRYSTDKPEPWYIRRGAHKGARQSLRGPQLPCQKPEL
jgi:hypothetical protein